MHVSHQEPNANRENARSSTGPTSGEGKAKMPLNALETGLTGVTVFLPSEEAEASKAVAKKRWLS